MKNHPEIFGDSLEDVEENERTDDENDFQGQVFVTHIPTQVENHVEKHDENEVKNHQENDDENAIEDKLEDVLDKVEDVESQIEDVVEELKSPSNNNKEILDLIDQKFSQLQEETEKKYNDMLDGYMELRNSIKERKHIDNTGIKSRIDNICIHMHRMWIFRKHVRI